MTGRLVESAYGGVDAEGGMRATKSVLARFSQSHEILDKLYDAIPVGIATPTAYTALADQLGVSHHAMHVAKRSAEAAGILDTTLTYQKGIPGRTSVWTLLMERGLAHEELEREHQRQLDKPSRKAERRARSLPTGGPISAPRVLTVADARALLERAKEHIQQFEARRASIAEARRAGLDVDEEAELAKVPRNEGLELIARLLPYVNELEHERDRAVEQARRWQPKGEK